MTEEKKPRGKAKAVEPPVALIETQMYTRDELAERQLKFAEVQAAAAQAAERRALRDEFAKAALTGLLAHHGQPDLRSLADAAFQYADFMLEIRDDSTR